MIISFKNFSEELNKNSKGIYDFIEDLSSNEIKNLEKEIDSWNDKDLSTGLEVLLDYYGMNVPIKFLKEILKKDLIIAYEIFSGGVSDTCQRSVLCDDVLRVMNLNRWPTYGSPEDYKTNFYKSLKETAPKYGINVKLD